MSLEADIAMSLDECDGESITAILNAARSLGFACSCLAANDNANACEAKAGKPEAKAPGAHQHAWARKAMLRKLRDIAGIEDRLVRSLDEARGGEPVLIRPPKSHSTAVRRRNAVKRFAALDNHLTES